MSTATLPDRAAWLAERNSGIGASDAAVALGVSPWKSAFQLWAEKTCAMPAEDLSDNEAIEFGLRLEPVVAEAFADRTSRKVDMRPAFTVERHPDHPWLLATLDAIQYCPDRGPGNLQIKTANEFKASDWADGTPLMYQVQVQAESAVSGLPWGSVAVLIGGQRLRWFDYQRDDAFIAAMIPRLRQFWRLVETKTPPPPGPDLATARALALLYGEDNGETILLPDESAEWDAELVAAKEAIKEAEARKVAAENHLKAALGEATFGLLPSGAAL